MSNSWSYQIKIIALDLDILTIKADGPDEAVMVTEKV